VYEPYTFDELVTIICVFMNHESLLCTFYENMCVYEPYTFFDVLFTRICVYEPYTFDELVTKICVFMNQIMISEHVIYGS
jgi:hypothetical protein